jgi:hypothetical protein
VIKNGIYISHSDSRDVGREGPERPFEVAQRLLRKTEVQDLYFVTAFFHARRDMFEPYGWNRWKPVPVGINE